MLWYLHSIGGILDHSKTLSKEFSYIPYWLNSLLLIRYDRLEWALKCKVIETQYSFPIMYNYLFCIPVYLWLHGLRTRVWLHTSVRNPNSRSAMCMDLCQQYNYSNHTKTPGHQPYWHNAMNDIIVYLSDGYSPCLLKAHKLHAVLRMHFGENLLTIITIVII